MTARVKILRASPLTTIQDAGRPEQRKSGINASGPMDRNAFHQAGHMLKRSGSAGIEFTMGGLAFKTAGEPFEAAFSGGLYNLKINDEFQPWPHRVILKPGDEVSITPGSAGNYGYVRFSREIDVPSVLGSRATNLVAGLGGLSGKALQSGDNISLFAAANTIPNHQPSYSNKGPDQTFRFIWGIHADQFSQNLRNAFVTEPFKISTQIDRMGARLDDPSNVFNNAKILSLVSDAVVPGDIQILGDGTPIVLMRDHQITGGYPRIGTLISADLDRFAQTRPHQEVRFKPVTLTKAHAALMGKDI